MSKTPEELAEEYGACIDLCCGTSDIIIAVEKGFLAGYKAAQQWISVKDRLPDYDQLVLIWHPDFNRPFVGSRVDSALMSPLYWWRCELDMYEPEEVITHWMPLPAPPKEEK